VSFYRWYNELSNDTRKSFYEVIMGKNPQKPHFDLDIPLDEGEDESKGYIILDKVIEIILSTMKEKKIILSVEKDICVYVSHGPNKFSSHIVVNHWVHKDYLEAKAFGHYVISQLPEEWNKEWVDQKVYNPHQQFRLLFSTKYGSMRHKTLLKEFTYHERKVIHKYDVIPENEEDEKLIQFEESIVGFSSTSKFLPSWVEEDSNNNKIIIDYKGGSYELEEEDIKLAMDLLPKKCFSFKSNEGGLIYLIRHKPSYCEVCQRPHEHENPFLRVDKSDGIASVYFYCRRDMYDRSSCIGTFIYNVPFELPSSSPSPSPSHSSSSSEEEDPFIPPPKSTIDKMNELRNKKPPPIIKRSKRKQKW